MHTPEDSIRAASRRMHGRAAVTGAGAAAPPSATARTARGCWVWRRPAQKLQVLLATGLINAGEPPGKERARRQQAALKMNGAREPGGPRLAGGQGVPAVQEQVILLEARQVAQHQVCPRQLLPARLCAPSAAKKPYTIQDDWGGPDSTVMRMQRMSMQHTV